MYEISDTSRDLIKNLDTDVTITVIAETDSINEMLSNFLDRYTELSDRITMETIDPVMHPSALTDHGETDLSSSMSSLLSKSGVSAPDRLSSFSYPQSVNHAASAHPPAAYRRDNHRQHGEHHQTAKHRPENKMICEKPHLRR